MPGDCVSSLNNNILRIKFVSNVVNKIVRLIID